MAANSSGSTARVNALIFWDRFDYQVNLRVREFNEGAGKSLLAARSCGAFVHQLTIEYAAGSACSIKCAFDLDRGALYCDPGPALPLQPFQFLWKAETPEILQENGEAFTLEVAIDLILSRLTSSVKANSTSSRRSAFV